MVVSVIVPTYNETLNITPLTERLSTAMTKAGIPFELLFMDDESEGSVATEKIVTSLKRKGHNVRVHMRTRKEGRGLSSAVLMGFRMAKYDIILCMDADLQHEPEAVPSMVRPVVEKRCAYTVGSRNVKHGGLGFDWSLTRRLISSGATLLAKPVSPSTDPMSGFFCTTKKVLERSNSINPVGFKINLEIMARCGVTASQLLDVPITFRERVAGESKLTMKQNVEYVKQLLDLYWHLFKFRIVILCILTVIALHAALV